MKKYIYQTAMNQNSNLMMGKEENENTADQWFMTGIIFYYYYSTHQYFRILIF